MIQIGRTLVSEDLLEREFVCNLSKCKGACCVEGDAGAPLLESETAILDSIRSAVEPYLRPEGVEALNKIGNWEHDNDGDLVTPLIDGKECAYTIFLEDGTASCGIEKAWRDGAVDFKKPISCHLYPVRITRYKSFEAVNYHSWNICSPACALGEELKVPVYSFLKDALTRNYGEEWYSELEDVAKHLGKA